ncbi:MAG: YdjY domain-containing protein, partial [Planctomycetota bacterium]
KTDKPVPPDGGTNKDKAPTSEIPQTQVITMSMGEKVYYKAGLVEKIEIEGAIANPTMPLEFVACADGGKAYESLVVLKCKPWNVQLALILAGLKEGGGPKTFGDTAKPTGDLVLVSIAWQDKDKTARPNPAPVEQGGGQVSYRVEELLIDSATKKTLDLVGWSFSGSMFVDEMDYDTGKPTGKKIYLADIEKNIIASWHDPAAILNIPTSGGLYLPYKELLPAAGTKIIMTIRPPTPKELEELKKVNAEVAEREKKLREEREKPAPRPVQPERGPGGQEAPK